MDFGYLTGNHAEGISPGDLGRVDFPSGTGVRVDAGVEVGLGGFVRVAVPLKDERLHRRRAHAVQPRQILPAALLHGTLIVTMLYVLLNYVFLSTVPISELSGRLEVGALSLLGHQPMLDTCVGCGREKTLTETRVNFGLHAGGIFCSSCRKGKTNVVSLSSETWKSLIGISQLENDAIELPEKHVGEMRKFLDQYISHHLGYRPRLQKYITGIKN